MKRMVAMTGLVILTGCTSLPVPPVVDGSDRRSINSRETTELLALRAQLAKTQEQLYQRDQNVMPATASIIAKPTPFLDQVLSQTVSVQFPFNGTKFNPTTEQSTALLPLLNNAQRIVVRGRTDGTKASAADEQVALNRALSAKHYLVNQGVSPLIISVNYLSGGDYIADNRTPAGRALNRRVDIEVFR